MESKDPKDAFTQAISEGRLSTDKHAWNYFRHFIYMGPAIDSKHDSFKHYLTREYLPFSFNKKES